MTKPSPIDAHAPRSGARAPVVSIRALRTHCSTCSMRELCLPVGLDAGELEQLDRIARDRLRLAKGESLYRAGTRFTALYAVRVGSLKTVVAVEDGREQVAGYHMIGDIVGLDGIGNDLHGSAALALEDAEVCVDDEDRVLRVRVDHRSPVLGVEAVEDADDGKAAGGPTAHGGPAVIRADGQRGSVVVWVFPRVRQIAAIGPAFSAVSVKV